MKDARYYSPKKIAEAIGVSESSLKRWCDRGLIRFSKTAGGHRRIVRSDAVTFFREAEIRVTKPELIGLPALESDSIQSDEVACQRFLEALVNLNEVDARKLLISLYVEGWKLHRIFDGVVAQTFRQIGILWSEQKLEVYKERHACEITANVIREIKGLMPEPDEQAPFAIGGSLQGDHYSLPTLVTSAMLQSIGFRAMSLGNNIPVNSMCTAAQNHRPQLFWISVSHIEDEAKLIQDLRVLRRALPTPTLFLVGGSFLNDNIRSNLDSTIFCDNMHQLDLFASNLSQFGTAPTRALNNGMGNNGIGGNSSGGIGGMSNGL